jgi:hypothetical protein
MLGWEGDIRGGFGDSDGGPWFAPLPISNGDIAYAVAWKQDNNGETFVASSISLPWLEHATLERIEALEENL